MFSDIHTMYPNDDFIIFPPKFQKNPIKKTSEITTLPTNFLTIQVND